MGGVLKGLDICKQPYHHVLGNHLSINNFSFQKKQPQLLERFKLTIPIFHAYGHKGSCQVQYMYSFLFVCFVYM